MNITTIELKKITASPNTVLTNGNAYGEEIYLGVTDSPENWREITQEEYNEILKEQEEQANNVLS